jgi:prevent-host-death family protein
MVTKITATELARNLSDILNRAQYKGERFVVERNGEDVVVLEARTKVGTWKDLVEAWAKSRPDDQWADDLEAAIAEMRRQPLPKPPEWPE